jgi:hypothetical protein
MLSCLGDLKRLHDGQWLIGQRGGPWNLTTSEVYALLLWPGVWNSHDKLVAWGLFSCKTPITLNSALNVLLHYEFYSQCSITLLKPCQVSLPPYLVYFGIIISRFEICAALWPRRAEPSLRPLHTRVSMCWLVFNSFKVESNIFRRT